MLTKESTQVHAVVSIGSAFQRCDNNPNVAHMAAARTNRISPRQTPARWQDRETVTEERHDTNGNKCKSEPLRRRQSLARHREGRTAAKMGISPGVMTA